MAEGIYGKKCPKCGHINDEFAMVCSRGCPGGFSRITAQYHEQEGAGIVSAPIDIKLEVKSTIPAAASPKLYCKSTPDFVVEIKDGFVIGREGDIDVTPLAESRYISRRHAAFIRDGDNWLLRAESKTNPTTINYKRINFGEAKLLKDSDLIALSNITFVFKIS